MIKTCTIQVTLIQVALSSKHRPPITRAQVDNQLLPRKTRPDAETHRLRLNMFHGHKLCVRPVVLACATVINIVEDLPRRTCQATRELPVGASCVPWRNKKRNMFISCNLEDTVFSPTEIYHDSSVISFELTVPICRLVATTPHPYSNFVHHFHQSWCTFSSSFSPSPAWPTPSSLPHLVLQLCHTRGG